MYEWVGTRVCMCVLMRWGRLRRWRGYQWYWVMCVREGAGEGDREVPARAVCEM